ncbi:MAG: cyclic nucleotide-binding domain-containing protein [Pseudomonadota bacterium]
MREGAAMMLDDERVLFVDGEEADAVYLVTSGVIRCCLISEDGRRHIFSFATAGRLLGLPFAARRHFTAEAVSRARVLVLPLPQLEKAAQRSPELVRAQRRYVRDELRQRERHLLRIASLPAEARLRAFLSDFAQQAGKDLKLASGFVALPMSRRDIADHLGLTLETVSRAFGALRRRGQLELLGKSAYRLAREANEQIVPAIVRLPAEQRARADLRG